MSGERRHSAGETKDTTRNAVVVLVEDEPGLRSAWLELLREVGYSVHEAADGRSGLHLVREVHPDVVITDLVMPVEDGRALASSMRDDADLKNIPIIAATGESPKSADAELFDVVLRKPFDSAVLLRVLTQLLVPVSGGWRPMRGRDTGGPLRLQRYR
jgi:CheY-like chemotaxis protein